MSRLYFPAGKNYIPQDDFTTNPTENGGWEGTQSFLAKKSMLTRGSVLDQLFIRGRSIVNIDPKCPVAYSFLTLKLFKISDHAPGVVKIDCEFTGYGSSDTNGSSGNEISVPTYSLRGTLEEAPLSDHPKWKNLSDASKNTLGQLLKYSDLISFDMTEGKYGRYDSETGEFTAFTTYTTPTGDELAFARLIAQDKATYKKPAWTYTVRTESKYGFSSAQLASLGKITSPPGNPAKPGSGWKWMLVGPDQEQSGNDRFYKDLTFQLIASNDENDFLYDS